MVLVLFKFIIRTVAMLMTWNEKKYLDGVIFDNKLFIPTLSSFDHWFRFMLRHLIYQGTDRLTDGRSNL